MKITINYTLISPLSHIGETASTGSYFQTILTTNGRVPVVTGNSIRGKLRDSMATHLLCRMGGKVSKEVFHVLFSGGNLNGTISNDIARAKAVREHFPMISLLGGGLGSMIMAGKLQCSFAYPICIETNNITGLHATDSWHSMIDTIEFTRTDDSKDDTKAQYIEDMQEEQKAKASTQMRYEVEYLAAGTQLQQTIVLSDTATGLELGALYAGIKEWWTCVPVLGGLASKGFGKFCAESYYIQVDANGIVTVSPTVQNLIDNYEAFIASDNPREWLQLLSTAKEKKGMTK